MGNPHNRWFQEAIVRTEEESKKEKYEFEKKYQDNLLSFRRFFDRLSEIGQGRIVIKDIDLPSR
jgi:hypothetical protein